MPAATQGIHPDFAFRFQLLRASDLSPVNAQRVAAIDGKKVPCAKIVIGCEYAKDKFVVVRAGNGRIPLLENHEACRAWNRDVPVAVTP